MNTYRIILEDNKAEETREETVERLTFPEAVSHAYSIKNTQDFKWIIRSVELIKNTRAKHKKSARESKSR